MSPSESEPSVPSALAAAVSRRRFLEVVAAGLASSALASGRQDAPGSPAPYVTLASRRRVARARGVPLLVVLIPSPERREPWRTFWEREVFGSDDLELLADLTLCAWFVESYERLARALPTEYVRLLPDFDPARPLGPHELPHPWAILIETDRPLLHAIGTWDPSQRLPPDDFHPLADVTSRRRELIRSQFRSALARDIALLERRVAQVRTVRGRSSRSAAHLRLEAEVGESGERERGLQRLVRRHAPRLLPIAETSERAERCGSRRVGEDGRERVAPPCGTAHTGALGDRFLRVYAR